MDSLGHLVYDSAFSVLQLDFFLEYFNKLMSELYKLYVHYKIITDLSLQYTVVMFIFVYRYTNNKKKTFK